MTSDMKESLHFTLLIYKQGDIVSSPGHWTVRI